MKYGARSNSLDHSGIRFESDRNPIVKSRRSESRFPHWRGVFMIALLCTLAACGDGDSGTAASVAAARAAAPGSASTPVLHCASACH
ncbi:hypothetical protein BLA18110_00772 [Burkholderia lata]|uniref:Uncharacterized protein n=1 Tax=Burkholderia lata (strain ATCC 17760 / DSM 23089 / LMG 22485 / NCIMB 9086 / R18194 / 383) TaxID=482957 RepID=A0A6P2RLN7_BURL3|nr:hypothetical protein [Burkholderia sp. Ac-20345]VWC32675.1 hypothetical protein BLA14095_06401 [Burkholderia lata]VWC36811.1 hypothetical protein BLA15945_06780 [Burkholderia lata]VWC45640.1 hypothetical protein BLA15816_07432 [Burkholderia lata]VWC58956.1 hypothetical protein BLA18110_00772 [Burkholderia lata]